MTREQVALPAVRAGKPTAARVRFAAGDVRVVEAAIGDDLDARGEGPDLFEALAAVRRVLEASSVMIACNGSARTCSPRRCSARRVAAGPPTC